MALCVYESGNTTIRNGSEALLDCPGYVLLNYDEYIATTQSDSFLGLPPLTVQDANTLLESTLYLWFLALGIAVLVRTVSQKRL